MQALEQAIAEAQRTGRPVQLDALDAAEGNALLVRHVAAEIGRRLGGLKDGERIEFCNRLLSSIGADGPESQVPVGETKRALPSVYRDALEPPPLGCVVGASWVLPIH